MPSQTPTPAPTAGQGDGLGTLRDTFFQSLLDLLNLFPEEFESWFRKYVLDVLVEPLVGTPAPEGASASGLNIAFKSAVNSPWNTLIDTLYFDYVVGLAFGLQLIVLAAVGVRYQAINPAVRKKIGRRMVLAFFALFFWLPVASISLQFFDVLGQSISTFTTAEKGTIAKELFVFGKLSLFSPTVSFLLLLGLLYIYAKVLVVSITRWMAVILITLAMPLVATFWALEVWPFQSFSGLSKQIAGTYPGAIAASIPTALLIRISIEINNWGVPGMGLFISPLVLLLCAKLQKAMLQKSSPTLVKLSDKAVAAGKKPAGVAGTIGGAGLTAGAYLAGGPAAGGTVQAAQGVLKGNSRDAATGARMVHREMSGASSPPSGSGPSGGGPSSSPSSGSGGGGSTGSVGSTVTPPAGSTSGTSGRAPPTSSSAGASRSSSGAAASSSTAGHSSSSPSTGQSAHSGAAGRPTQAMQSGEPVPNHTDTEVYHHEEDATTDTEQEFDSVGDRLRAELKTDADVLGPDAYRFDDQPMNSPQETTDE
ncbi:hypothetical protein KTS45_19360 [Halomicroarcula limicola]|uniref:Uncharacterized protein n=1 Tax=Haloarcula limicola TaxID=1429915 RepID=A0A8J7Y7Y7_9EURY|nr:hypothetical protein [Halomicroarcula limicola]MBV0926370.1 hypothetical protein [Halomicroarcula limicola]